MIHRRTLSFRLLTLGGLLGALAGQPAWAVGGGSLDPGAVPVAQAPRVQVDALDNRFLVLTASIETTDLPELK